LKNITEKKINYGSKIKKIVIKIMGVNQNKK
jgi:hypothetical protein